MKAEPLNINDKRFLINRLIEQAPINTLIREFFKNADESAALAPGGNRHIEIYPVLFNGVRKLAFWNTGPGMDAVELKKATDLSSSIGKDMALDANFGIGAKVSGLTMSKAGIRYRFCINGAVSEVTIGYDKDEGTYVRFPAELPDGSFETVYDVTDAAISDGRETNHDWTEVVLFGESEDHDTVAEPMGKGRIVDRSFVPSAIFRRFAAFSTGVDVRIDVAMTKGGGKDETGKFRQLRPLADILDKLPRAERVRDADTGLAIHYIHDPKHPTSSHSLSSRANPATSSTTFCAVVHKNNMALPNQYRDGLTWPHDRGALSAEDFADYVRELMPTWVKDVIRSESPDSDDNLDDLQTDLQRLLDEFRVPTVAFKPSRDLASVKTDNHFEGVDTVEHADIEADELLDDLDIKGDLPLDARSTPRAKPDKVRKAPAGAKASKEMRALERVPQITILTDPDEIADKGVKGRAGRYYSESQTLFVNGLYPIVERMAAELELELAGSGEPEVVRTECLRAARRSAAFRVGKVTCYAISKRLSDDWSADDLDSATSPESLSMAADDYKQGIQVAKKWARKMIKASKVESADAA